MLQLELWRSLAASAATIAARVVDVDALSRWFDEQTSTPAGSILLFLLVFLTRVAIDRWDRKRVEKKQRKRKGPAVG